MRSKVVLFEQIRRDSRVEGLSVRALAQRHKVQYSVPARFINRRVRVTLRSNEVIVLDGRTEVARHEDQAEKAPRFWCWITTWRS